jgi:hypothetical protein
MLFPGIEKLSEETFLMYAIKAYNNPQCLTLSEFHEDLKRIKYIKRLINRYLETGTIKERLILNHLVVLFNIFGPEHGARILFFKIEPKYYPELKTFLVFLNMMPERITGIWDGPLSSSDIPINIEIANKLRKI